MQDRNTGANPGIAELKNAKAAKTVLDGRYEIKKPVGYGGFSIVYDAKNLNSGQRVAIKECTDRDNKERFMREARLLRDFSNEPAIVSVIDYFEEDGIAYIVMEFLKGRTLRDEIRSNGVWDAEKTVRLFDPVMKTLERMHAAGVIHRDISPDNLMLLDDGRLILLDFGAARENVDRTVSKLVVKASYSPPEQMDEKGVLGSWSDVYSTCATMYYCITGNNPEDALSRMFLDELKTPTRFGANILASAEKTLMKGLSTESRNRVQDMNQLRTELEKAYPILTEEEKAAIEKKKKRRKILIAAAAVMLIACVSIVANAYRLQIMFHMIDSEELILEGSGMTAEEFDHSARIVKKRMAVFSDGKMIWNQNKDSIDVIVPQESFDKDVDIVDYVIFTLARPMKPELQSIDENGDAQKICDLSQREDVRSAATEEDGKTVRVTFTQNARKKIGSILEETCTDLRVAMDTDFKYRYVYYKAQTTGDGKSIRIIESEDADFPVAAELIALIMTQPPSDKAFAVGRKWENDVKWEDPGTSVLAGKNQLSRKALDKQEPKEDLVSLKYEADYSDEVTEGYDMSFIKTQTILKNRLDALDLPYAIGSDEFEEKSIVVRLPINKLYREEVLLLGTQYLGTKTYLGNGLRKGDVGLNAKVSVIETKGKEPVVSVTAYSSKWDRTKVKKLLESLQREKAKYVYLSIGNIEISRVSVDDALEMFARDGTLKFTKWRITEEGKAGIRSFCDFFNVGAEQVPDMWYRLKDLVWDEELVGGIEELMKKCPHMFLSQANLSKAIDRWEKENSGTLSIELNFEEGFNEGHKKLKIRPAGTIGDQMTAEESVALFGQFFARYRNELAKAAVDDMTFYFEDDYIWICADEKSGDYYIRKNVLVDRDPIAPLLKNDANLKDLPIR